MVNILQKFVICRSFVVAAMVISMEQEKYFKKIENVLDQLIIRFGKSQSMYVIEYKQEHKSV